MADKTIYKVAFRNQDEIYEIYAKDVQQSDMLGFIEVMDFVFGAKGSVVVDPSEERLRTEFAGVKSTFIPIPAVIRIDEVEKEGVAKVCRANGKNGSASNISHLPIFGSKDPTSPIKE